MAHRGLGLEWAVVDSPNSRPGAIPPTDVGDLTQAYSRRSGEWKWSVWRKASWAASSAIDARRRRGRRDSFTTCW